MPRLRTISIAALALSACTAMSQNLRGQELSYRGAFFCPQPGCAEGDMQASRRGATRGDYRVHEVKLDPRVAVVFTAAAPFSRLEASVIDCEGKSVAVDEGRIFKPKAHGVGGAREQESWVVMVDREALEGQLKLGGQCDTWLVRATAHWDDGRHYTLEAGLKIQ